METCTRNSLAWPDWNVGGMEPMSRYLKELGIRDWGLGIRVQGLATEVRSRKTTVPKTMNTASTTICSSSHADGSELRELPIRLRHQAAKKIAATAPIEIRMNNTSGSIFIVWIV